MMGMASFVAWWLERSSAKHGSISVGDGGTGGWHLSPPLHEITSGKLKITRALNFGEDLFFRDYPNPMKKGKF